MTNLKSLVVAVSLVVSLAAQEASAQLADPTRTRSTTQVVQPPPPRQVDAPRPTTPPPMPTQLGQRQQSTPVATPQPASQSQSQDDEPARRIGAQPAKVYDRNGRAMDGMEQAGPNRVRDTRTGRYYDTVPMGDGQRIQPGH